MPEVEQYRFQMAVEDYDRDGFLDIAIATLEGDPWLLHSQQGRRFADVAEAVGLSRWPNGGGRLQLTTAWIDYDNDGFPDLIMGERLYHNLPGQRFVDVTAQSQLKFQNDPMGCVVADYDCDGRADLYVLYQHGQPPPAGEQMPWVGDDKTGAENELWRNEGNGVFRNVTAAARAGGGRRHSFAAAWFFYDGKKACNTCAKSPARKSTVGVVAGRCQSGRKPEARTKHRLYDASAENWRQTTPYNASAVKHPECFWRT